MPARLIVRYPDRQIAVPDNADFAAAVSGPTISRQRGRREITVNRLLTPFGQHAPINSFPGAETSSVMQNFLGSGALSGFLPSAQQGRDAALLRATTELFTQDLSHDRDEIRRYEELATHFLPRVSPEDRAFVAERLAVRIDAPQSVVRMLAKDRPDIARRVIPCSPVLGALDLLTIIAATGPEHYRLVAERPNLPPEVEHALRLVADQPTLDRLNGEAAARHALASLDDLDAEPGDIAAEAEADGNAGADDRLDRSNRPRARTDRLDVWQFLGLDPAARLRLMAGLATRPPMRNYSGSGKRLDRAFRSILSAAQVVGFARKGERQPLVDSIADGLGIDKDVVSACLDDASGEPVAVLLKGLGLDNIQAQQVFLLGTPEIGRDVTTFFRLTDIYAGMENWVAEILIDAWRNPQRAAPRHEPHFAENALRRRPGTAAERPAAERDRQSPGERAAG